MNRGPHALIFAATGLMKAVDGCGKHQKDLQMDEKPLVKGCWTARYAVSRGFSSGELLHETLLPIHFFAQHSSKQVMSLPYLQELSRQVLNRSDE